MKLLLHFLAFLSFCPAILSAQNLTSDSNNSRKYSVTQELKPAHCSSQTFLLLKDLQKTSGSLELPEKYTTLSYSEQVYVPILMKVEKGFDFTIFEKLKAKVNTQVTNLISAHIPINRFVELVSQEGIRYIELAKPVHSRLDKALKDARIDLIHQGLNLSKSYSGAGVVIGIIDQGFDYTHPTFSDPETSELRIKRVWEQNTLNSIPPAGYFYGKELATAQAIIDEKTDINLKGHGTHVSNTAAGSGIGNDRKHQGVAYESELVLVSMYARDGKEGNNLGVIDGINYIKKYAEMAGKPAVINLSLGHHLGPHDGNSLTDQTIDAFSGPGCVIVGAVGNEGDDSGFYLHWDHAFQPENEILTYLVWPDDISGGKTLVEIWGEEGSDFSVSLEIYNPRTNKMEAATESFSTSNSVSLSDGLMIDLEGDTTYFEGGLEVSPLNNRPHAQFTIDNTSQARNDDVNFTDLQDNDFVMFRFKATKGTVHAYAANNGGEAFFTDLSGVGAFEFIESVRVQGGNPNSTMGELGGTAKSIVSVGAYISKSIFENTKNEGYILDTDVGNAYVRSSRGPTHDGRIKPDISAPAGFMAAAESSYYVGFDDLWEVDRVSKPEGGHWSYRIRLGTSMAAPVVTGLIAMMLEANPELTPTMVKEILKDHARSDDFTGTTPNLLWGHGKVDGFAVISSLDQVTSIEEDDLGKQFKIYPNPNDGSFYLETAFEGVSQIKLLDYAGKEVFLQNLLDINDKRFIQVPAIKSGLYLLQIIFDQKIYTEKIMISR